MSAYASLPGSFMPPFFAFGTPPEGAADGPTPATDAPPSPAGSPPPPPLRPSGPSSPSGAPSISSILPPAFQDLSLSPLASRQESSPHPADILIVIRSARVDPVELIRGLTSRGTRIARRTANFISRKPGKASEREGESGRGREEAADSEKKSDEVSVFSGPDLCEDSDSDDEYSMYDYSDDFSNPNDDDDDDDDDELLRGDPSTSDGDPSAIKFELSINFQGRKYNATRAYPKFVKLRNDLLRELNIAEGDNGRRGKRHLGGTKVNSFMVDPKKEYAKGIPSSPSHNISRNPESGRCDCVTVPELPRVSPTSLGHGGYALSGVARSGFALLQATAQHYCPEMELWMRHVIAAFPCSQSLSQFLWEPLSSTNADCGTIGEGDECHGGGGGGGSGGGASSADTARGARGKSPRVNRFMRGNSSRTRSGSTSTLESIEEGDGDDWDDDHSM